MISLVLLMFCQAQSPVPGLLDRIKDPDPVVVFRAIGDLADLGPAHRTEIEKGAASLPAFYRDALLAELKWGGSSSRRVSLKGSRTLRNHIADLVSRSELKFDLAFWAPAEREEDRLAREDIPLEVKEARELEALAALCSARRFLVDKNDITDEIRIANLGGPKTTTWALGQRRLLVMHQDGWTRKFAGMNGRSEWTAGLHFVAILAKGARLHGWKDIRVVEALSEKGADLRLDPGAAATSILDFPCGPETDGPYEPAEWLEGGFPVHVRLPDGVEELSRLKVSAVALAHTKYRSVTATAKGGEARAAADGISVEVKQIDRSPESARFTLRLRADNLTGKELASRPLSVEARCSGNTGGVGLKLRSADAQEAVYEGEWNPSTPYSIEVDGTSELETLTVYMGDGLQEWPVYFEFRDIPLK